ncbi:MAG: CBS domain-containing protein [Candidatus Aenigmarchaeota archaeon]|nr:CBS domain-containing protein [Candidatus Aenigmarchaeota archaeon]
MVHMLVEDVMRKQVITAKPSISVSEAAKIMNEFNIGCLVIVDNGKLIGIITDSDMKSVVARGLDAKSTKVSEVMTKRVLTIEHHKPVDYAIEIMAARSIKRLPVTKEGKLVGLVSVSDIIVVVPSMIHTVSNMLSFDPRRFAG